MLPDYIKLWFFIITVVVVCITFSECEDLNTDADNVSDIEDTSPGPERILARRTSSRRVTSHASRRRPTSPSGHRLTPVTHRPTRKSTTTHIRPTRPTRRTTKATPPYRSTPRWITKATTPNRPPTTRSTPRWTTKATTPNRPPITRSTPRWTTKATTPLRPTPTRPAWRWSTTKRTTIKPTTTKPPKMKWKMPKARYTALFGGLAGTAVGTYLGYQIAKIDWEANVPAYSVQHHWHQQGYPMSTNTVIKSSIIKTCSKNVNFCAPNTIPMCLYSGRVYCVVPESQTQQCANSTVGACVSSTLKLPCESRLSFECFFTGYKYEQVSIPCLRYIRVIYRDTPTSQNQQFFVPSNSTGTPGANNTCKCNNTQPQPINKMDVTCIKVNVSNTEKILCSGLNLTNNTAITLNSTLNITNSRNVSCLPNFASKGSITSIFDAHKTSTLARCEMLNDTSAVGMSCGHLGNLTNNNIPIPIDPNVVILNCTMENSTLAVGNLSAINTTLNATNVACLCNGTLITSNVTSLSNTTAKGNATTNYVYSVGYCISIAAIPMKLYNNKEYMQHLNIDTEERQQVINNANQLLAAITHYLWF